MNGEFADSVSERGLLTEDENHGRLPSGETLLELLCQTANVLAYPLRVYSTQEVLGHLVEVMPSTPQILYIQYYKAAVAQNLVPTRVEPSLLCASFLLLVHFTLTQSTDLNQSQRQLLGDHLLLYEQHTWNLAAHLTPHLCNGEEVATVNQRLAELQKRFMFMSQAELGTSMNLERSEV